MSSQSFNDTAAHATPSSLPSSAPAGAHSGIAAFVAELRASLVAQQALVQEEPTQALHVEGGAPVLTFDIIDFDQDLLNLEEEEVPQLQEDGTSSLLAMPMGEIEVIQGTFDVVAPVNEGAVDEADLDSDDSSDGGDTEEYSENMDWEDDDAEDTLGGDSSFWA